MTNTCSSCQYNVVGLAIDQLEPDHPCQGCVDYDLWQTRTPQTLAETFGREPDTLEDVRASLAQARANLDRTILTELRARARSRQVGGDHYKEMGVEPWDVVDTWPIEQRVGAYRAGALKYLMRAGSKDAREQDFAKAHHYLEKLLEVLRVDDR